MTRSARLFGLAMALGMALALPGISFAQEPPAVTQVYLIDTNGKTDVLLAAAKNNEKIFARLGIAGKRTYRMATLAGAMTGQIALTIDYPNLEVLAAAQERLANDAEWQQYLDKLEAAGITATSSAVWVDITP